MLALTEQALLSLSWFVFTAIATYAKWTPDSSGKLAEQFMRSLMLRYQSFAPIQHVQTAPLVPRAQSQASSSLNSSRTYGRPKSLATSALPQWPVDLMEDGTTMDRAIWE